MAKEKTKSHLPNGYEPLQLSRSAGFFLPEAGNRAEGILTDIMEQDDPFNKGRTRFAYRVQLTEDGTKIVDATTKKERLAETGELIGIDEKGYLRVLRTMEKGRQICVVCLGQQDKAAAKKGRSPAWLFEVGAVPA